MKLVFKNHIYNHIEEILAGLLGAAIFLWLYGPMVLDPSYVDYLKCGGDLSQHYYGWELYRQSDFQMLIGMSNGLAYPYSTSVIFTDSIPLFAVIFKIFCHNVTGQFQYFGLWGLMCFVLQGAIATKLIKRRMKLDGITGKIITISLSVLFILCPFFVRRMFWHSALAGQFIILLAIDIYDKSLTYNRMQLLERWLLMGMLCASVHLYFLAMVGSVLMASCIYRFIVDCRLLKNHMIDRILDAFVPVAGFTFFAWYVIFALGGFNSNMDGGAPGLGYYSFNLNGLFNADDGYSRVLSQLPLYEGGQYEGNAYLGLGMIILLVIAIIGWMLSKIVWLCRYHARQEREEAVTGKITDSEKITSSAYAVATVVMVVFVILLAASNKVTFGDKLIVEIPISGIVEKIYSPFRSSGRLIWPVAYILMLWTISELSNIYNNTRNISSAKIILSAVAIIGVVIQIYDISGKLGDIHLSFKEEKIYHNFIYDDNEIVAKLIDDLSIKEGEKRHIVFLNKGALSQEELYAFTDIAIKNNMTINDFYFARNFPNNGKDIAISYVLDGRKDCLYVFKMDEIADYSGLPFMMYTVGDLVCAVSQ